MCTIILGLRGLGMKPKALCMLLSNWAIALTLYPLHPQSLLPVLLVCGMVPLDLKKHGNSRPRNKRVLSKQPPSESTSFGSLQWLLLTCSAVFWKFPSRLVLSSGLSYFPRLWWSFLSSLVSASRAFLLGQRDLSLAVH